MSDGKIIIDTSLDNKGFEKGSASLINAIENLEKQCRQSVFQWASPLI